VTAFRFVDDCSSAHAGDRHHDARVPRRGVGDWAFWDATGRINVLDRATDDTLDLLAANGLREVASVSNPPAAHAGFDR